MKELKGSSFEGQKPTSNAALWDVNLLPTKFTRPSVQTCGWQEFSPISKEYPTGSPDGSS